MLKLHSEEKFLENDLIFINSMSELKSRYLHKGVCTLLEIFPRDPLTSKKFLKRRKGHESGALQDIYGLHDNSDLVRKIFSRFMIKILTRISYGGFFEMSPYTKAHLVVKPIPDELAKGMRQRGFYSDFDIVRAGFKIPRFAYDFGPFSKRKDVFISVPIGLRKETLKRAENRQIQWTHIPKTFNRDVQDD